MGQKRHRREERKEHKREESNQEFVVAGGGLKELFGGDFGRVYGSVGVGVPSIGFECFGVVIFHGQLLC